MVYSPVGVEVHYSKYNDPIDVKLAGMSKEQQYFSELISEVESITDS